MERYIRKGTKRFMKNKKGIQAILAALLLVVIVVGMSGMVYAWSSGLLGGLMMESPSVGETISMDAYSVDATNDNATLYLRNTGDKDITLVSYYITNPSGATAGADWTIAPALAVNSVSSVRIPESGAYADGFDAGYAYTIKVITASGTQFTFAVRA